MKCGWCGDPLKFDSKKGWVHMDGEIYKKRPDGKDDHCVLPRGDDYIMEEIEENSFPPREYFSPW